MPVSLLKQRDAAIFRCTGHKAAIFHGKERVSFTKDALEKRPIVLTTYGMIQDSMLHQIKWHRIVFDEAHHLRNGGTARFKEAKNLRARIRWLVSGTPIQNKPADFYALCDILRLSHAYFSNNIEDFREKFVLKRTKQQIGIDLPPVVYEKKVVSWQSKLEHKVGGKIHSFLSFSGTNHLTPEENESVGRVVLPMFMRARQSCIDPSLAIRKPISSIASFIEDVQDKKLTTSKIDSVVQTILNRKDNGNGKLIFSHFKREIDLLVHRLREGGVDDIAVLDGRNSNIAKSDILSVKHDILILQIQTGCEGLNLQADYSEIYFVSPHWNPSVEDQAIARCHRIGQTKPVFVFRFVMDGFDNPPVDDIVPRKGVSIDDYVTFVQEKKREFISRFI